MIVSSFIWSKIDQLDTRLRERVSASVLDPHVFHLRRIIIVPGTYFHFLDNYGLSEFVLGGHEDITTSISTFPDFYSFTRLSPAIFDWTTNSPCHGLNILPFDLSTITYIDGDWCPISCSFDDRNLYHFLYLCLPALRRKYLCNSDSEKFFFAYKPSILQLTLLSIFFPKLKPIAFNLPNEHRQTKGYPRYALEFESIWASPYLTLSDEDLAWIQYGLQHSAFQLTLSGIDESIFPARIFVSRLDSNNKNRTMINSIEIEATLSKQGFKVIVMSNHSIQDQIMLFHQAEVIVFEHGAAGAWLAVCKRNTKVVELIAPRNCATSTDQATHYEDLASRLNLRYGKITGDQIPMEGDSNIYFSVCPNQLNELIYALV